MQKRFIITILLILLILVGGWLRIADLGGDNFQNDEFFHVETAQGYLEIGDFVMWDFLKGESKGDYIRAFPYTWLVAQSFKVFGISEWSGRLPSLIFGILLLPLIYFLSLRITKSHLVSLLVLVLLVFDNSLIWSSRVCRMYSMLFFFSSLTSYLLYLGFENKFKKKINNYLVLGLSVLLLGFGYLIHEVVLILGLGFLVYFIINFIYKRSEKKYLILGSVFSLGLIGGLLFNFFVQPLTTNDFFVLRQAPNWDYFKYPFNQLHFIALGWLFLLLGVFLWKKLDKLKVYYLSLALPVILFFVFFAQRYPAKKYVMFVIIFLLIFYVDGLYRVLRKLFDNKKYFYLSLILLILVTGPLFSWPGVKANAFMQTAQTDKIKVHNFKNAYNYIEQNYRAGEPVLIQGAHEYYFSRTDLNLISLKAYKEFGLEELKQYQAQYQSGWVVWPKYKEYHLSYDFKRYCEKNLEYVEDLEEANMEVYRWGN